MNEIVVDPVEPIIPITISSCDTFIAIRKVRRRSAVVRSTCLRGVSGLLKRCEREARHGSI